MKVGIIIAMEKEYQQMVQILGGQSDGFFCGNEIVLCQCGIGKVNAAINTTQFIAQHHPDCIISTGVAGGIDNTLHVMDVVVAHETVYHDVWCGEGNEVGQVQGLPARFEGNKILYDCAMSLNNKVPSRIHGGLTCTGDRFITNRTELDDIKRQFPEGLAVDMESAAIAQTCYLHNVPFISFRIVSDTPGATSNHANQYKDFWKSLSDSAFEVLHQYLQSLPRELK